MRETTTILVLLTLAACRSGVDVTPAHAEVTAPVGESMAVTRGENLVQFPPFIRVVARPELYHEKRIQLVGYMNLEFEGNGLHLSEELYRHGDSANAIWLDVEGMRIQPPFSRGWVIVEGTFNGERLGHFGMYSGTLKNITRMDPWRTPN